MYQKRGLWLGLVCLLLAVIVGCWRPSAAGPSQGRGQGRRPEVLVGRPVVETITDYEDFTGHTEAMMGVEIRARVSGYLVEGLKDGGPNKEGTEVKKGELLFEIDPRTYEADKNKAEAALAQSQAHLERLTKDLKRAEELLPTRSIAQGDYDQIAGDHKEAEAAVKTAQAALRLAELNLEFTKVRAPCDGRVSKQLIDPGNMVQADQTPLTTIVTLDPIYAYFDIDERTLLQLRRMVRAGKLKSAREAKVKILLGLADEEDYPHEGMIDFADNRLDVMTGTLRLRGVFPNPKRILSPGMFARIRLPIGGPHRAILIPEEALGSDQGQRFLYVVNDKNEVEYRRVQIGSLHGKLRVIKSGLAEGDRVVLEGLQRIQPGIKVQPKNVEATNVILALQCEEPGVTRSVTSTKRLAMFSRFFIDRPIFATVLSVVITLGRRDRVLPASVDAVSAGDAADGASPLHLSRGQRRRGGPERGGPDRAAGQRRREHDLHGVAVGQRRLVQSHGDVPAGREPEPGPGAGAEQGESRPADAAGRAQADRRDHPQNVPRHAHVGQHLFAPRPLRPTLSEQLRADAAARRDTPRAGGERHHGHGAAGLQHEDLAGPGQARRAEPHGRRRGQRHPRAEHRGGLGPDRARAGPPGPGNANHAVHARAGWTSRSSSPT